jgi:hypothetical protein
MGVRTVPSQWAGDTGGWLTASRLNIGLFAIVATLWTGAMVTPDLATCAYGEPLWALGYQTLLTGWVGPLMVFWHPSFGMFAWYANVFLLICLVQMFRGRAPAAPHAVSGLMLALTALAPISFYSEARGEDALCARGPGFWLWIAGFVVTAAAAAWESSHPRPASA